MKAPVARQYFFTNLGNNLLHFSEDGTKGRLQPLCSSDHYGSCHHTVDSDLQARVIPFSIGGPILTSAKLSRREIQNA